MEGDVDRRVERGKARRERYGGPCEPNGRPRPAGLDLREDLVAYAISGEPLVGVRGVLPPRDPFGLEPLPELAAPEREEGADDAVLPAGPDPPTGAAEASLEVQEDRLRLVLERVAGPEQRSRAEVSAEREQGLVPEAPRGRLEALSRFPKVPDREAPEDEGRAERRREIGRGARVPVPLDASELVVDVKEDDRDRPATRLAGEEEREGRRVAPARAGGDERGRPLKDVRGGDVAGEGGGERAGAARGDGGRDPERGARAGRGGGGGGGGGGRAPRPRAL